MRTNCGHWALLKNSGAWGFLSWRLGIWLFSTAAAIFFARRKLFAYLREAATDRYQFERRTGFPCLMRRWSEMFLSPVSSANPPGSPWTRSEKKNQEERLKRSRFAGAFCVFEKTSPAKGSPTRAAPLSPRQRELQCRKVKRAKLLLVPASSR